jgi:histidine triad (HIT) family protein
MSASCIFCRIAAKDVPSTIVFEDDHVVAFRDLSPQAPTHILIVPRRHVSSLDDTAPADRELLGKLLEAAKIVAHQEKLRGGYRVVTNVGPDAGQSVLHLHFHVLGGRPMAWPPG